MTWPLCAAGLVAGQVTRDVIPLACAGTAIAMGGAHMLRLLLLSLAVTSTLACSDEPYDESWGNEEIPTGKADGLLDSAELLDFDEVGTGYVEYEQMDVYAIDLKGGDAVTATMTVTSGNLSPHFTFYYGGSSYISSASFQRQTKKIIKTYALSTTGRYYVAVKAYQNSGAGKYTFKVSCNGGPCAGEPVVRVLTVDEQAECVGKARVCSFAALPQWNGAVGASRARSIFETCLGTVQTTDDGVSCAETCAASTDARGLCDSVINALPFYADVTTSCLAELDDCLETCHQGDNNGSADELWTTAESICWETGFNGTCDSYARGHKKCGGTYADGTNAQCHELCESTDGAWMDDLDTICTEACD